jgi:hypothetical protein
VFIVHFYYVRYYLLGSHVLMFVCSIHSSLPFRNFMFISYPSASPPLVHFSFGCYMGQLIRHLYICSHVTAHPDRYSISDGRREGGEQRSEKLLARDESRKEMGGGCQEFNSKLAKAKS